MGDIKAWSYFEKEVTSSSLQVQQNLKTDHRHSCFSDETLNQLLNLLGLENLYPRKISTTSVIEINFDYLKKPKDWKEVPWWTLKKIISSDFSYRENIPHNAKKPTQSFNFFDDEESKDGKVETHNPHPADVFCVIFLCCDDFLREVLCQKMAKLQAALPLTFTIGSKISIFKWPLNRLFLAEDCKSVLNAEYQAILFLRLGIITFPKSEIINEILRKHKHETFCHKRTKTDTKKRSVSKGCIELSWYIKDKEYNDFFPENLTLLNLRGDGLSCETETKLILPLCSIIVLFMEYSSINDFLLERNILSDLGSAHAKIIVVTKFPKDLEVLEIKKTFRNVAKKTNKDAGGIDVLSIYDLDTRNDMDTAEIGPQLAHKLKRFLTCEKGGKALREIITTCMTNSNIDICVDEERLKEEAGDKITQFMSLPFSNFSKSDILPLQGSDLWQTYSKLLKENKRLHKKSCDDYNDVKSKTMSKIRDDQVLRLCSENEHVMGNFVETLIQNENKTENLLFFTSWLRCELDTISRQAQLKRTNLLRKGENSVDTAMGLEHFFREMGQCFEAFKHFKDEDISHKTLCVLNKMPKMIAKLLLLGIPLEIMDGDAGNIPLTWIKAVFDEIQIELPNKKLLSLSVVGIQSSGKSTMLNTMFGVQFDVSCGRCTSGIYMQLISVQKSEDFSPQYDYIMLFDTEGLRAVEEGDTIFHDNELATMIVGIADIVVFNIKGETITEIENVLQIVVYALLRIKQVYEHFNIRPCCVFLHQNAEKGESLREQMLKITKNLNKVTKTIADRECINTDVKEFKDVIDFDPEENVKYISNLWLGRPPMAPVSESYSRDILNAGDHILRKMSANVLHCRSVEDSMERIQNTWEAILAEDFVFSFRNTLEVKAYNSLDSCVKIIIFDIEKLKNRLSLDIDPAFSRCDLTVIDSVFSHLNLHFEKTLNTGKYEGLHKIQEFVEHSELKSHIIHWKKDKEIDIEKKAETMKRELKDALNVRLERRKLKLVNNDEYIWRQMFDAALELAKGLKNEKLSEETKLMRFEEFWTKKVNELVPQTDDGAIFKKHEKLWEDIETKLRTEFHDHKNMLTEALKAAQCKQYVNKSFKEYYKQFPLKAEDCKRNESHFKKMLNYFKRSKEEKEMFMIQMKHDAYYFLLELCTEIDLEMDKFTQDFEYDMTSFTPLLAIVRNKFKSVNNAPSDRSRIFLFTHNCETKFASALSFYVYKVFCEFNEEYEKSTSVLTWIESKKERARKVFVDTIRKREDLLIVTNELSREIQDLISVRIKKSIPWKMKENAERRVYCKYQILVDFLVELAEKENFEEYKPMLSDPYCAAKNNFLEQGIESFVGSGDNSPFKKYVEHEIRRDKEELIKAMTEINHENMNIMEWVKNLAIKMPHLEFKHGYECEFERFAVFDFQDVQTNLIEALDVIEKELIKDLGTLQESELKLAKSEILKSFDEIWGCPELCPFCYEPCQFDKDHIKNQPHRCIQHRPNGLAGWRYRGTLEMIVRHCNWNVASSQTPHCGSWCGCKVTGCEKTHAYKKYKDFMPDWDIPPINDLSGSPYWSWMVVRFMNDLMEHYRINKPNIPVDWKNISKQKAIESIKKYVPKS